MNHDALLADMLARVPDAFDKQPGSAIYAALAPCAFAVQQALDTVSAMRGRLFALEATGEDLTRLAAERGLSRRAATHARLSADFLGALGQPTPPAEGARFSGGALVYVFENGLLRCEAAGTAGNAVPARLLPVSPVDGLLEITNIALAALGAPEEPDEVLRARLLDALRTTAFAGNAAAYRALCLAQAGVSGVRVYPAHAGGGTVRLVLSAYGRAPTPQQLDAWRQLLLEQAPIGHALTVEAAQEVPVDLTVRLTGQATAAEAEAAVAAVLAALANDWMAAAPLIVRASHIERALLDLPGVLDARVEQLAGGAGNLTLAVDALPVLGVLTLV